MIKIYTDYREIDKVKWDSLVKRSATATFFQTRGCYDFYASLSFMRPFVFAVEENEQLSGLICGYTIADGNVVKQFFSRRAIVPGGALLGDTISDEALQALLQELRRSLSRKAIYAEFRNYNDYSAYKGQFEKAGFVYQPHLNFHVATPDAETALSKLSSSKRRQIKQTLKSGVEICKATTKEDVQSFYVILEQLYKTKVKSPLFPIEFFEKLICLKDADILLLKKDRKVLGGICCIYLFDKSVSEWFVCGNDGETEKTVYPSVLATWAGIEYAANNGYPIFDFMGAGKPEEDYGVREFKSKFGGELVEHGRYIHIFQPQLYALGKWVIYKIKKYSV